MILPVNLLQHLHPLVNVGDVILGLIAWLCYRESCRGRNHELLFFIVLILLMDPVWFLNGGSQGSVTYYFFAAAVYPAVLCRGKMRSILVALLMINISALLILEYFHPSLSVPFQQPHDRLIDLVAGAVCSCLAVSLLIWVITADNDWENLQLSRYARDLATSERNYREVVENAKNIILRVDPQGKVAFFNKFAEELFGYKRDEIIGQQLVGSIVPAAPKTGEDLAVAMLSALERPESQTQIECESITRDGRHIQVSWTRQPVYDHNQKFQEILLVGTDVTERIQAEERRRQSEQQLVHIQRLESLGILAGGIAHDFNNLLTGILGNISLSKAGLRPNAEEHDLLQEAEKACFQARGLTAQLLTFSRGGKPVKTTVALKDVVQDSAKLALRGSAVRCDFQLPDDLWPIEADAGQLAQVFSNLVINAQQAMLNGGQITIEACNLTIRQADQPRLAAGRYVQVKVCDEGVGIASETLPKIFDPYFSTKKTGSGLGLAVVYSIVKKHHGTVTVESQVGTGTTFTLLLPVSNQPPPASPTTSAPLSARPCRILVMDDEERVLTLLRKVLVRQGHTVECVNDGAAAVTLYQEAASKSKPFDLVIMDLTIPGGMGGREAIQRLREIDPHVKAIVSSGYSDGLDMADHKTSGFKEVLPKPYTFDQLRTTIQKVVNG